MGQKHSVLITTATTELWKLKRSWRTSEFTDDDGIGPMDSLYQAGDSLVGVARGGDRRFLLVGSGVMVGPGLLLTATHVLDDFPRSGPPPVFLTFLPDGARAWLPIDVVTSSGRSPSDMERLRTSDMSVVSCTLNSDARSHCPLVLAPLKAALPLRGERLWAFGYRQGDVDGDAPEVTPLVSSGLVTAVFPNGRGERMPAACVEVAMDTWGGMSGGPVANAQGYVVGIVSSSFEGGPSYVTLIWDALRHSVRSAHPIVEGRGRISLFTARNLGLVKLYGNVRRQRSGDVVIRMTPDEIRLLAESTDALSIDEHPIALDDEQIESFEEQWSHEMEEAVSTAAIEHLERLSLTAMRSFLAADGVPANCLERIRSFDVEDFEGVEDFEVLSNITKENTLVLSCSFDLRTVIWTVRTPEADYCSAQAEFEEHSPRATLVDGVASMKFVQRCFFECDLTFDQVSETFTDASVRVHGVRARRRRSG